MRCHLQAARILFVDMTVYDGGYHTSLGWFSKLDCSTTKKVPVLIPNDTSSECSRRDDTNADVCGTDSIPTVETSSMETRPRGGWYTPSYTVGDKMKERGAEASGLIGCRRRLKASCEWQAFFILNRVRSVRPAVTLSVLVVVDDASWIRLPEMGRSLPLCGRLHAPGTRTVAVVPSCHPLMEAGSGQK